MTPTIRFIENEAAKNELFAEFVLKEDKNEILIGIILIDNRTNEIKERYVNIEGYEDDEYMDSANVTEEYKDKVDFEQLKSILLEDVKGEDLTRNWFT